MLLSTQTDASRRFSQEGTIEAVKLIAAAGFDAFDLTQFGKAMEEPFFSPGREEYIDKIKKTAEECGIVCNQSHAPFPSFTKDDPKNADYPAPMFDLVSMAIENAGRLGAKCIVVHSIKHVAHRGNEKYLKDVNMEYFRALAPVAKKAGIKIALENLFERDPIRKYIVDATCADPAEMCDWLDTLGDDDAFTVCLDLGHATLCGREPDEVIRALGGRIGALHVQDNDYIGDRHTMPFTGIIKWENVCRALAEVDYKGDFTFESDNSLTRLPYELLPAGLRLLHETGAYLRNRIESYRGK